MTPEQTMRGWADGAAVAAGTVMHDARGRAAIALPKLAPGAYRLRYETEDDFGARFETQAEYMVVGDPAAGGASAAGGSPLALPAVLKVESGDCRRGRHGPHPGHERHPWADHELRRVARRQDGSCTGAW